MVSFLTNVNVAALLASRGLDVSVVVCERTHPPLAPVGAVLRSLRARTYPSATRVVVQTQRSAEWLHRHVPGCRTRVIANPLVLPLTCRPPTVPPSDYLPAGTHFASHSHISLRV